MGFKRDLLYRQSLYTEFHVYSYLNDWTLLRQNDGKLSHQTAYIPDYGK